MALFQFRRLRRRTRLFTPMAVRQAALRARRLGGRHHAPVEISMMSETPNAKNERGERDLQGGCRSA